MNITEILAGLEEAIKTWMKEEKDSLERDLNEVNLSAQFAAHLKPYFKGYNVDAEYDGDWGKPNDVKALQIARNRILEVRRKLQKDDTYRIRPDVIIHRRKSNDFNLVAIEVKKDIHSQDDKDFDLIKLEHLTIDYLGNHYNYRLGVAIVIGTNKNAGNNSFTYFQEGLKLPSDKLR